MSVVAQGVALHLWRSLWCDRRRARQGHERGHGIAVLVAVTISASGTPSANRPITCQRRRSLAVRAARLRAATSARLRVACASDAGGAIGPPCAFPCAWLCIAARQVDTCCRMESGGKAEL